MKKLEYVSPEMEAVEIKAQCSILAGSVSGGDVEGDLNPGTGRPPLPEDE